MKINLYRYSYLLESCELIPFKNIYENFQTIRYTFSTHCRNRRM